MIDPKTSDDLNAIQAASGLGRGEFAVALGYSYDTFKSFYSGRLEVGPNLRKLLIMWQMLSKNNIKLFIKMG